MRGLGGFDSIAIRRTGSVVDVSLRHMTHFDFTEIRMLHADHALAVRHERAAMTIEADYARAHAALDPTSGIVVARVADGSAVFAGVGSPMTQATGLGMEGPITDADIEALEAVFFAGGSPAKVVVCPHADESLLLTLGRRGYRPVEFENVMVRNLDERDDAMPTGSIDLRAVGRDEGDRFAEAVGVNFSEDGTLPPEMRAMMMAVFAVPDTTCVLATIDGQDAGGGTLLIHKGLAMLAGAGTLAEFRNRGVHTAVFAERLRLARRAGCDLAVMGCKPGSASQRNAERKGFRVAYTKVVVERQRPG